MDPVPAISVQRLVKQFGKNNAVRDLSFEVPVGRVCGLVGPNGAGKTTTIKILLNLLQPDAGQVRVLGLDPWTDSLELRRRIGYVPEHHNIYQWMKVNQVLEFAAGLFPTWDWQEVERINDVLQLPRDRKVMNLSRGELAKLALITALAHQPVLLILDEPTSGLAPLIRRDFLDAIALLIENHDRTMFFSTHILSDVERVADHVIEMDQGGIVADQPLDELRSRFVKASFLFDNPPPPELEVPGARRVEKGLREWVAVLDNNETIIRELKLHLGASDCLTQPLSLEDAFIELVNKEAVSK